MAGPRSTGGGTNRFLDGIAGTIWHNNYIGSCGDGASCEAADQRRANL